MEGHVKWFSPEKGYGFILGDNKVEYFVHFKDILQEGYKSLHADDRVSFSAEKSEKGAVARSIAVIN